MMRKMSGKPSAVNSKAETNPPSLSLSDREHGVMMIRLLFFVALIAGFGLGYANARPLKFCGADQANCVVDGDTFRWGGRKIRIADIDTPEIGQAQCDSEKRRGLRAKRRLSELLGEGDFQLVAWKGRDEDRYGRKLRVVMRGGRSLGDQ